MTLAWHASPEVNPCHTRFGLCGRALKQASVRSDHLRSGHFEKSE